MKPPIRRQDRTGSGNTWECYWLGRLTWCRWRIRRGSRAGLKEIQDVVGHREKAPSCVKDYTMRPPEGLLMVPLKKMVKKEEEKGRKRRDDLRGEMRR